MANEIAKPETVEAKAEVVQEFQLDPLLSKILSTRRGHGSAGDTAFRIWLFNHLDKVLKVKPKVEVEGCILVTVGKTPGVLFSCHVDTCHGKGDGSTEPQALAVDPNFGHVFLADKTKSSCLGGDDGCGIYIMLRMLEAGVEGSYIFHTGEEVGGIGSSAFVRKNKKLLESFEMVVAFDRAVKSGTNPEVIITQGGQECASTEFGQALCAQLNANADFELPYVVSHKGSFTDSKNYRLDVPECVNVACFYEHQHTPNEYVDAVGLEKLVQAAIAVEWSKLPVVRNPAKAVQTPQQPQKSFPMPFGGHNFDHRFFDQPAKSKAPTHKPVYGPAQKSGPVTADRGFGLLEGLDSISIDDLQMTLEEGDVQPAQVIAALLMRNKALEAELEQAYVLLGM